MQEFINLYKGGISVKDYSLKFTKLSKSAHTIVVDSRDKMNKFIMVISDLVFNECRSAMLIPIMDISHLIIHAKKIEEQKLKKVGKELKRTRAEYGNCSNARFEVKDKRRFKKRLPNQRPSTTLRIIKVQGLHQSLKRSNIVVLMLRSLLVLNVVENIKASVYSVWEISMVVEKAVT